VRAAFAGNYGKRKAEYKEYYVGRRDISGTGIRNAEVAR